MTFRQLTAAIAIGAAIVLSSCGGGGGGGGSNPAAAPPSNDWDSMVWDQGNWG